MRQLHVHVYHRSVIKGFTSSNISLKGQLSSLMMASMMKISVSNYPKLETSQTSYKHLKSV